MPPEVRACPACGGPMVWWRTVVSAEPSLAGIPFTLVRCPECGTAVTVEPAPADAHEAGAYAPGPPRLARAAAPVLSMFDRQRLRLLRGAAPPPARLLDAGAGRGRFVAAARRAGYDAIGLEPSDRGARGAAARGVPVVQAGIDDARFEPRAFDVVTLWHVLEHLESPGAALRRIHGWMEPGGALLLGVPNLDSLQARLAPERWFHLDVPRHRVHFTVRGVERLLERSGFAVMGAHHVLLEHNPFGMWQSLLSRLTRQPSYVYNALKHNARLRSPDLPIAVAALPLLPAAALLELAAGVARRGGTVAVLARRSAEYH